MKTLNIYSLFIIGMAVFIGCQKQTTGDKKTPIVKVKTATVTEVVQSFPIHSSGMLASRTEAKLSFKTGGIIQAIYVGEGQTVKKGTLLARLNLSEIEAQVKQAELAFEKSQRDLKRVENLYRDSVATLENFQDATTAMEVAGSNLQIAQFNLQYSKIVAPADGKILKKLASTNELVNSGMPVFLFAPTMEDMVVRVHLIDKEILRIDLNDSASISFDAYPMERFPAKITEIANTTDPYTGTYEVELQLESTTKKLISGFIARAVIYPADTDGHTKIPVEALVDGWGRLGYVFVAKNNKPERRKIFITRVENDKILVSEGLEAGEQVITEGAQYIDEKSTIEVVNQPF